MWHPDVRLFRVYDAQGADIAAFTSTPTAGPAEKRGGAWMDECVGRSSLLAVEHQAVRLPVAYLVLQPDATG